MTQAIIRALALVLAAALGAPLCPAQQPATGTGSPAQLALDEGARAYKAGKFDEAVDDFKRAKEIDPSLITARLYLATAYASQYIPGAPSEENTRLGQQAVEEFRGVLEMDPKNLAAIDRIGSVLFQMGGTPFDIQKLEESKSYHKKHIEIKPSDPEPYYWVGVIDWTIAYQTNNRLRREWARKTSQQIVEGEPLPDDFRRELSSRCLDMVNEGIEYLNKAMSLRPDYDDAKAYLNLLYRQKAQMEPTPELSAEDLRKADELVDEVKRTKEKKMESPERP